ncbi:MAG TPA: hypothetical protein ENN22_02350, partial [bacterium]|nr:hypothetical protein [bacterium]
MLTKFDWLLRCRSGTELLATLKLFQQSAEGDNLLSSLKFGGPSIAIGNLCQRCHVYASVKEANHLVRYCQFCRKIQVIKKHLIHKSQRTAFIWGYLNQIPQRIKKPASSKFFYGSFVVDENRFLVAIQRQYLREWLQELVIYGGTKVKGTLQIIPSTGIHRNLNMGDYLSWAVHHQANLGMSQLWVRFYTEPNQIINPKIREKQGVLSYTIAEFISMLEMVEIFRAALIPDEQQKLFELLQLSDPNEKHFYWGRFL